IKFEKSKRRSITLQQAVDQMRNNDPPIIGRVEENTLFLDPRTVLPHQDILVTDALKRLFSK
ncbi:MAG TPA: hypothetical protein VJ488_04340, partial [Dehalococcoidia bacterium]|nr:hypothetical protein [Dehalococcoidia bacterium]